MRRLQSVDSIGASRITYIVFGAPYCSYTIKDPESDTRY